MIDGKAILTGKLILLLEDEFLIAVEAADTLKMSGATVLGPCYTINEALDALNRSDVDAAVLDINIDGQQSDAVAQLLRGKKIPVVFTTGYGSRAKVAPGSQVLDKPYGASQLVAALATAMSER